MTNTENFRIVEVTSAAELRAWLSENHSIEESIWLVTYKKCVADKYVSVSEVLDELLCFGWIDGIRRKLDEERTMQLISPRKAQHWAKSYKDRVAKLEKEGRMMPPGIQSVEEGKRSGLWNFMDDVDALILPDDFIHALKAIPGAYSNFNAFNDSSKRNMLRHIKLAKTEKTRAKRIAKLTELATQNKKLPGS